MIYEYYLMTLLNVSSNAAVFEWRFESKSDIALFRGCSKGDVLTTVRFEVMDCEFYMELTPNGWDQCAPEGSCCVWLAVSALPSEIKRLSVEFTVKCKAIDFEERKTSD